LPKKSQINKEEKKLINKVPTPKKRIKNILCCGIKIIQYIPIKSISMKSLIMIIPPF
jgi:hypothetical protein